MLNNELNLVKVSEKVAALDSIHIADLAVRDNVESIVAAAAEANDAMKAAKDADASVKANLKRLAGEYGTDKMVLYGWDAGKKATVSIARGEAQVKEQMLLDELYAAFGEDKSMPKEQSKAWAAFKRVCDPVEIPYVINPDKLRLEMERCARIQAGVEQGKVIIDKDMVARATVCKSDTIRATIASITKAEKKAHEEGAFNESVVW